MVAKILLIKFKTTLRNCFEFFYAVFFSPFLMDSGFRFATNSGLLERIDFDVKYLYFPTTHTHPMIFFGKTDKSQIICFADFENFRYVFFIKATGNKKTILV